MLSLSRWINRRADLHPGRTALIGESVLMDAAGNSDAEPGDSGTGSLLKVTYGELNQRANRLANSLAGLGIARGDRVGILSLNCVEYVEVLFAAAKLGIILVPLNVRLTPGELKYQLNDSGSGVLMVGPEFAGLVPGLAAGTEVTRTIYLPGSGGIMASDASEIPAGAVEVSHSYRQLVASGSTAEPDGVESITGAEPFLICYTSGTTGKPKGAVLTQQNLTANAINNVLAIDITSRDVSITLLPLFHIGGIGLWTIPTLFSGGTVVIPRRFDPARALAMIEATATSLVFGVPTILKALLECPGFASRDLSSVRMFYSGGAPCPVELIEAFHARGHAFGQGYGLTETSPTVFMLDQDDFRRKAGSIGKPAMLCDVRVADDEGAGVPSGEVGELLIRGMNVFKEYWNLPEATAEALRDGWFHTGDLARTDGEGFFYIAGRKKDLIISGGENIYPIEVEQVLESHPAVAEAAVIGVPHPHWGEVPKAVVVLNPGGRVTAEELAAWCQGKLARYKIPKVVDFAAQLPRNATGKILKRELK